MKKFLLMIFAAAFAVSCSTDGPSYSSSYPIYATFEYPDLSYSTVFGPDSTFVDTEGRIGIGWGDLCFSHKISDSGEFEGGFMLSYLKASGMDEKPEDYVVNPYRVTGPEFKLAKYNTYSVFYANPNDNMMPEKHFEFLSKKYGVCTMDHCWVNNTEAVHQAIKDNFTPGDELILKANGYLDGELTGTASIKLAADTTIYNWTKFNLKPLGIVDEVEFEMHSTARNIPTYFCLDEMMVSVKIEY